MRQLGACVLVLLLSRPGVLAMMHALMPGGGPLSSTRHVVVHTRWRQEAHGNAPATGDKTADTKDKDNNKQQEKRAASSSAAAGDVSLAPPAPKAHKVTEKVADKVDQPAEQSGKARAGGAEEQEVQEQGATCTERK